MIRFSPESSPKELSIGYASPALSIPSVELVQLILVLVMLREIYLCSSHPYRRIFPGLVAAPQQKYIS